ncbi:sensor domain-containing diguanylate cyclase [Vibrio sp. VPAP30]|uniref:sensor domain-containing diguanylate cyclase n=1 Tax=Vibrio sp. VPAP30 TaxID=1647102 RepID=UPI000659ED82|nr:sensor domain-containing diguanylate cyclase [Vibrio sp. VPAP30]KLN66143.1 diguanylate cyclase [Vibrio sp. VPAP30]
MNSTFSAKIASNPDMMHEVLESLPEPTFLIDKSGTYVEAWGGRDKKRHHDPTAVVGLNQYQVLPADKAIWFSQVIVDVIESQTASELEYSLDPKDLRCFDGIEGPQQVQHFSALVIPLPNTSLVLWTVRNITEYKRALDRLAHQQIELERLTYIDHLSQMYNRYALDALLPEAIELAKLKLIGSAVLMIDVDCFKQYNDSLGHQQGDKALKTLSSIIHNWAKNDDLCFRYGGDEFLVFIPNVIESESIERAKQLQEMVNKLAIPHPSSSVGEQFSITIGIRHCHIVPQDMNAERFIAIADKALFYAKGRQRGSIHQLTDNEKSSC